MPRQILVQADKTFMITVPDDAVLSFGPFSPPNIKEDGYQRDAGDKRGTLRVYSHKKADILAVFSGVRSFRDTSIEYAEEVVVEKGDSIWRSDRKGYYRESNVNVDRQWVTPELPGNDEERIVKRLNNED